jgi:hypothetical protein
VVDWGQVRGTVAFDSAYYPFVDAGSTGFTVFGSRSLLLTDAPSAHVHDTGGLSSASMIRLDPVRPSDADVEFVPGSLRLSGRIALDQERTLRFTTSAPLAPQHVDYLAAFTLALLGPGSRPVFWSPAALPTAVLLDGQEGGPVPAPACLVVVRDDRIALRRSGGTVVDWPLSRVEIAPYGPTGVMIRGGALHEGRLIAGVVLDVVHEPTRTALLALDTTVRTGDVGKAPRGHMITAAVGLTGMDLDGDEAECVLGVDALDLQTRRQQRSLAHFDLTDRNLRVAGSVERFVIVDPAGDPLGIISGSEQLGARLLQHPALQAAAARTLAEGPFPVETADGKPVVATAQADALRITGRKVDTRLAYDVIGELAPDVRGPRTALRIGAGEHGVTVEGQTELVQALHTRIKAAAVATATAPQVPDLLRAGLGLEEDYLLAAVFGPVYELHAALLGDPDPAGLTRPAVPPTTEADESRMTTVLTTGLTALRQHLDHVTHVLAPFLRSRDAELVAFVSATEPEWLKLSEARLRTALLPVQRVSGEVGQLLAMAGRLPTEGDAPGRADYTAALTMGAAAALINPVFAVAGLTQAVSQRAAGSRRRSEVSTQTQRTWQALLAGWTVLVDELVPTVSYTMTENVWPVRYELTRQLGHALSGAGEPALRRLAQRLAVLDVSRRYPAVPTVGISRGAVADHIRGLRERIPTPRFVGF